MRLRDSYPAVAWGPIARLSHGIVRVRILARWLKPIYKHEGELWLNGLTSAAQVKLADIYLEGRGVPQDYTEAAEWYRRAAEQGDAMAYSPTRC